MGERQEDPETLRTTRLRPRTLGGSVPVPPLIPTVVIISLVVGLVIGFGLSSRPNPPAPAAPPASNSTVIPLPPVGGLTLTQALMMLKAAAVGTDSPSNLISARIARFGEVASGALPPDRWVWAFVVRGSFLPASCDAAQSSPPPCAPSASTELAVFDYQTGEFIEDRIPAYP